MAFLLYKIRQRWPDIYKARENNPDHPIPEQKLLLHLVFAFSQAVHKNSLRF